MELAGFGLLSMKYVYLKQSNAVKEAERILAAPELMSVGGSDIFLAHFLAVTSENPKLVLSVHTAPDRDEKFGAPGLQIRSYFWYSPRMVKYGRVFKQPPFTLARRVWVSASTFAHIVRFRPDKVVAWASAFPLWACYLAARLSRATFVVSRHTRFPLPDEPWFRRLTAWVDKQIVRRADALVVHGPYLVDEAKAVGVSADRIIEFDCTYPPGSIWNSGKVEAGEGAGRTGDGGPREIMFLGRVQASKGVFDLLEACVPLLERDPGLKLVYAGTGDAAGELQARARRYGVEERVALLGVIPHEELPSRIRKADVVVTPTPRKYPEGRCMAAMEALVAGRPVIAPECGPFPYLVRHETNGLLYEPDSVTSLRENLARLLEDGELRSVVMTGARASSTALCAHKFAYYDALKEAFAR